MVHICLDNFILQKLKWILFFSYLVVSLVNFIFFFFYFVFLVPFLSSLVNDVICAIVLHDLALVFAGWSKGGVSSAKVRSSCSSGIYAGRINGFQLYCLFL